VNPALLIHAVVRQTMVLIAALATAAGQRAPLASVADQVFADLAGELKNQGLGHKVIADMFGMALRTYHTRIARLSASATDQGRSLWEAVLAHLGSAGPLLRAEVLARFTQDDESMVRGVLRDLVASGLVYRTGRGDATVYRVADDAQLHAPDRAPTAALESLVLVAIHRKGPTSRKELGDLIPLDDDRALDATLEKIESEGLVARRGEGAASRYECPRAVLSIGDPIGWEAAIFDHYQAVVTALVTKLRLGKRRADLADRIGGSTFVFDVWQGHPKAAEAFGLLRALRQQAMTLRKEIETHNRDNQRPPTAPWVRVIAYVGQTVKEEEEADEI
jgi:predicted MarR family transcription regulator